MPPIFGNAEPLPGALGTYKEEKCRNVPKSFDNHSLLSKTQARNKKQKRDTPMAATLQRRCSGKCMVTITKIILKKKKLVLRNYFVKQVGQDGNPVDFAAKISVA